MENPAFEVYVNNKKVCVAGVDSDYGVITNIVTWARRAHDNSESLFLKVSGLNSTTRDELSWINQDLSPGDVISIRITNNKDFSQVTKQLGLTEEDYLQQKLAHYRFLQEELKDYL